MNKPKYAVTLFYGLSFNRIEYELKIYVEEEKNPDKPGFFYTVYSMKLGICNSHEAAINSTKKLSELLEVEFKQYKNNITRTKKLRTQNYYKFDEFVPIDKIIEFVKSLATNYIQEPEKYGYEKGVLNPYALLLYNNDFGPSDWGKINLITSAEDLYKAYYNALKDEIDLRTLNWMKDYEAKPYLSYTADDVNKIPDNFEDFKKEKRASLSNQQKYLINHKNIASIYEKSIKAVKEKDYIMCYRCLSTLIALEVISLKVLFLPTEKP